MLQKSNCDRYAPSKKSNMPPLELPFHSASGLGLVVHYLFISAFKTIKKINEMQSFLISIQQLVHAELKQLGCAINSQSGSLGLCLKLTKSVSKQAPSLGKMIKIKPAKQKNLNLLTIYSTAIDNIPNTFFFFLSQTRKEAMFKQANIQ